MVSEKVILTGIIRFFFLNLILRTIRIIVSETGIVKTVQIIALVD